MLYKALTKTLLALAFIAGFLAIVCVPDAPTASATTTAQDLQSQINDRNTKIQDLEKEIAQYQTQLNQATTQAKTLQGNIKSLDTTKAKLAAEIQQAEQQIAATTLEIQQLDIQVSNKKDQITLNKQGISQALQVLQESDSSSIIETFLGQKNLADFFGGIESLKQFQDSIAGKVQDLQTLQTELEGSVADTKQKESQLVTLQGQLSDKQTLVEYDQQQKNKLLTQTKSQESSYQAIIAQKKAQEQQFNNDLNNFQSQLKLVIDPNSIPSAGTTALSWPLSHIVITQYFGNTSFSQTHASVYNGHGHDGVDLGTPIGTSVLSAQAGTVAGTGDTDLTCPGASYGRWVMVKGVNGLSTLYAHLSIIKSTKGQIVSAGDLLGYSGETGYATGPHLHFTVFATQGVEISSFASRGCPGAIYTMPVADLQAYLNPLSYLPAL
jgi:murein DD-endopeptidase MepM/ murein hydrolase activator NlpD